jgi:hypothetical protein
LSPGWPNGCPHAEVQPTSPTGECCSTPWRAASRPSRRGDR